MRRRLRVRLRDEGVDKAYSPSLNVASEATYRQTDYVGSRESCG